MATCRVLSSLLRSFARRSPAPSRAAAAATPRVPITPRHPSLVGFSSPAPPSMPPPPPRRHRPRRRPPQPEPKPGPAGRSAEPNDLRLKSPGLGRNRRLSRVWGETAAFLCAYPRYEENPAYAKCRDKSFPTYKDIEFLPGTTTAIGQFGMSSQMAAPIIDSSSSPSPGEDDTVEGVLVDLDIAPRVKDLALQSPHSLQRNNYLLPPAGKKKSDIAGEAIAELVEIGKQKLNLVRQMYQQDVTNQTNILSIEDCMNRVYNLPGITDEQALAAEEALLNDKQRRLFMTMNDHLAARWIERQVDLQNVLYKQNFPDF
uniref:ATP synthase F1 beta subunit domain-containing protein n=1 Tax=Ananas comosus var. bracteatus TaxID=296719 RepID=A0A6V7PWA4_ANACO|nr:unnamed protein product [Ananas comosus var. bracteatus]